MIDQSTGLECTCGQVALVVQGAPILNVECFCTDCQSAGAYLGSLPVTPSTLDSNSGTRYVLYRKDRVSCERGQEFLRDHRLSAESKTCRVIAICCNTPMFLDFTSGHWLSIYGGLWRNGNLPALQRRIMTRSRPEGVILPGDVPNSSSFPLSLFAKLFRAWFAMGFRAPKIDFVSGELNDR